MDDPAPIAVTVEACGEDHGRFRWHLTDAGGVSIRVSPEPYDTPEKDGAAGRTAWAHSEWRPFPDRTARCRAFLGGRPRRARPTPRRPTRTSATPRRTASPLSGKLRALRNRRSLSDRRRATGRKRPTDAEFLHHRLASAALSLRPSSTWAASRKRRSGGVSESIGARISPSPRATPLARGSRRGSMKTKLLFAY